MRVGKIAAPLTTTTSSLCSHVYALFDLTADEIKLIEESTTSGMGRFGQLGERGSTRLGEF